MIQSPIGGLARYHMACLSDIPTHALPSQAPSGLVRQQLTLVGEVPPPKWIRGGARKLLSARDRLVLTVCDQLANSYNLFRSTHTLWIIGDGDEEFEADDLTSAGPLALLRALPNMSLSYLPAGRQLSGPVHLMIGDSSACNLAIHIGTSYIVDSDTAALVLAVDGPPTPRACGLILHSGNSAEILRLLPSLPPNQPASLALSDLCAHIGSGAPS